MKARYSLPFTSLVVFAGSLAGQSVKNTTQPVLPLTIKRDLLENYVLPAAAALVLTGPYGVLGYEAITISKRYGKDTAEDVLKLPKCMGRDVLALDLKFVYNTAIKSLLVRGTTAFYANIAFPQLARGQEIAWPRETFDAANRAQSLEEFLRYSKDIGDEILKLKAARTGSAPQITTQDSVVISELGSYFMQRMKDAGNYFFDVAFAVTEDPQSAAIAASYLLACWSICTLTRQMGEAFRSHIGDARPANAPAMLPIFARGNDPFDKILPSTIGLTFSSIAQKIFIVPVLNSTYDSFGLASSKNNYLNDLACRAGNRGPFALDGVRALIEGASIFIPMVTSKATAVAIAAYMWAKIKVVKPHTD